MPRWIAFCFIILGCFVARPFLLANQSSRDVAKSIARVMLHKWSDDQITWFLPRTTVVPSPKGAKILMTLQEIGGSDYYGPVKWRESADLGKTWSEIRDVPGWGRRKLEDGTELAVCDVAPEYHAKTKTVLAIGHTIFYREGKYFPEQPQRNPVYVVRDAGGNWSKPQKLVWDDSRGSRIYTAGCAERVNLENGDILLPMSFAPVGRTDYSVAVALCSFDGRVLKIQRLGNELRNTTKRGLLEPSIVQFGDKFYLTIRAEDGRGYVAVSSDGLTWAEPQAWSWDNGEPLEMSTTQQHWLKHSDALYLVYMRKATENANVMRWRAPLYMALVDQKTMRLVRSTERVVFPLIGDGINAPTLVPHYGNFHTMMLNREQSLILAGEVIPANFHGDLLMARIWWATPNQFAAPKRR
ncbi:MAG: exo-alpha-sialidase [Acidobacteria bacterium]|nr:exo-alpha-sialidase [Acidobacteriota bacterium]